MKKILVLFLLALPVAVFGFSSSSPGLSSGGTITNGTITNLTSDNLVVNTGLTGAGTVASNMLDTSSVTKQGNSFNGASQLVILNGSSQLPAVSGVNLTALNASQITSGTLPNARLDASSVTLLGASIDAAELPSDGYSATYVNEGQANSVTSGMISDGAVAKNDLDGSSIVGISTTSGKVKDLTSATHDSLDASALTSLNASQLTSGTVPNARLDSSSVTLAGPSIDLNSVETSGVLPDAKVDNVLSIDTATFNTGVSNPPYAEGKVFYDNSQHTLAYYNDETEITHNLGAEFWIRVKNVSGATLPNGRAVYITGADAGLPTVDLAIASDVFKAKAFAVTTHDIENNTIGYVTSDGLVNDLNFSGFTLGDKVYLSSTTNGGFTRVSPPSPNVQVELGTCISTSATVGKLLVDVDSHFSFSASSTNMLSAAVNSLSDVYVSTLSVRIVGNLPVRLLAATNIQNNASGTRIYTSSIHVDGVRKSQEFVVSLGNGITGTVPMLTLISEGLAPGNHTVNIAIRSDGTGATQSALGRELSLIER